MHRPPVRLALPALVLAVCSARGRADETPAGGVWTPEHAAVAALLEGQGAEGPLTRDQVVAELRARAVPGLRPLFDIVGGRATEPPDEAGAGGPAPPPPPGGGDLRPQAVVRDVLRELPVEAVLAAVLDWAGDEPELLDALQAMRFLEGLRDLRALEAMLELLGEIEPVHLRRPFVRSQAIAAMRPVIEADERSTWFLTRATHDLEPAQLGLIAELEGGVRGVEGLKLLSAMLDVDSELDRRVVEALGNVSLRETEVLRPECIDLVRPFLRHRDDDVRAAAAFSLGRLGAHEAIPDVLDLLDPPGRPLAVSASWALEELAGRSFPDADAWWRWYDGERAWYEERYPQVIAVVRHADPGEMTDALRELVAHPLYRREVADLVEEILWHESDALVVMACRTLGQLGWAGSIDGLVDTLDHPHATAREAAYASLRALTQQDLPPEAESWKLWLRP